MTDAALGEKLNRSTLNVTRRRHSKGIAPHTTPYVWTPANEALLGQFPDAELGRRLGLSQASVLNQRMKLGIPAWKTRQ
jgi:hypothetical protein